MSNEQEFDLEHWVAASVTDVFAMFTDSDKMALWHGVEVRLEPRPGGLWWVRHENGSVLAGRFLEVEPPDRVVFTWGFDEGEPRGATPPGQSRVEVRLAPDGKGTRIFLRHTGFEAEDAVAEGWRYFLGRLGDVSQN